MSHTKRGRNRGAAVEAGVIEEKVADCHPKLATHAW